MLDSEQQVDFTEQWADAQRIVEAYVRGLVRDSHITRDIVQNTAVVLMRKFTTWDTTQAFVPWALGFAKFEVLAHFRDSARRRVVFNEELIDSITVMWSGVTGELDQEDSALRECLEKLTPKAREMIRLRYYEELELSQLADRISSTVGAVRVALMRTRRQLKDCVNRQLKTFGAEA